MGVIYDTTNMLYCTDLWLINNGFVLMLNVRMFFKRLNYSSERLHNHIVSGSNKMIVYTLQHIKKIPLFSPIFSAYMFNNWMNKSRELFETTNQSEIIMLQIGIRLIIDWDTNKRVFHLKWKKFNGILIIEFL